ncbi:hypothetical protein GIB67_029301 [Kingdonia uniflora]|uniref:S-protein homolog n=1 Tax=Kingdonia uniflora TaxID=39325 RepID=A0A7J7N8V3_9MAGN|nr:hypothetical protein GIB67_029301 [Kingdonia uniflora]
MGYVLGIFFLFSIFKPAVLAKPKVHVTITNRLQDEKSVSIQCQCGDDDLGIHTIKNGGQIDWRFSYTIFGSTLVYCDVEWDEGKGYRFDVYSYQRDYYGGRCRSECTWMITENFPLCLHQRTGIWEGLPFQSN